MGINGLWNGGYRRVKRLEYRTVGINGLWNGGYRRVKRLEYGTVGIDGLTVLNMERWV